MENKKLSDYEELKDIVKYLNELADKLRFRENDNNNPIQDA